MRRRVIIYFVVLICCFLLFGNIARNSRDNPTTSESKYFFDCPLNESLIGLAGWRHYEDPTNPILMVIDELVYDKNEGVFLFHSKFTNEKTNVIYLNDTYRVIANCTEEPGRVVFYSEGKYQNDKYSILISTGELLWMSADYNDVMVKAMYYDAGALKTFLGI